MPVDLASGLSGTLRTCLLILYPGCCKVCHDIVTHTQHNPILQLPYRFVANCPIVPLLADFSVCLQVKMYVKMH